MSLLHTKLVATASFPAAKRFAARLEASGCRNPAPRRMQMELHRVAGSIPAGSNIFLRSSAAEIGPVAQRVEQNRFIASRRRGSRLRRPVEGWKNNNTVANAVQEYISDMLPLAHETRRQGPASGCSLRQTERCGCRNPGPRRMLMELHRLLRARSRVRIPPGPPSICATALWAT